MAETVSKTKCPNCERRLKIPQRAANKTVVCPNCKSKFKLGPLSANTDSPSPQPADSTSSTFESGGAFDDIDQIIAAANAAGAQQVAKPTTPQPSSADQAASQRTDKRGSTAVLPAAIDPANATAAKGNEAGWVQTPAEKSLGNNGAGLLLLAVGFCLMPLAAGDSVPALSALYPYLPATAVTMAFVACFLMAYSKRRANIGSVILACLPLPFIGLLALGCYLYTQNFLSPHDDGAQLEPAVSIQRAADE